MTENSSYLPALAVIVPALTGVVTALVGRYTTWLREVVALIGAAATFGLSLAIGSAVLNNQVLTSFGKQFYADGLSALVVV